MTNNPAEREEPVEAQELSESELDELAAGGPVIAVFNHES